MTLKQQVYLHYKQLLQDRIDVFKDMISGLSIDSQNDAKGSAGDKHETALSMMHLEQEKLNFKLLEILQQKAILDKIDSSQKHNKIGIGSLVKTNGIWLFVATALPKINVNNISILAISPQSPLGNKLIGNEIEFGFEINSTKYFVEEIH